MHTPPQRHRRWPDLAERPDRGVAAVEVMLALTILAVLITASSLIVTDGTVTPEGPRC